MPSPSGYTWRARLRCRRGVSCASALRSIRRHPRTISSTCSAVPARPTARSRSSVSGVATRVSARTFEYDSSPRVRASLSCGSDPSARATRTCSRAAPGSSPTRQEIQWAHDRKPWPQPPRASNSRMRSRSRAVAASRCAASSAISSPRRSSSTMCGSVGTTLGPSMFIGDEPTSAVERRFLQRLRRAATRAPRILSRVEIQIRRARLRPREQRLLDDGVHAPVAVDHLRDAEVDGHRHQRDRLVLGEALRGHEEVAHLAEGVLEREVDR